MNKIETIKSMIQGYCPQCHQGKVFNNPPYSFSFLSTKKNCEVCNADFEPEPGFYYGAMYFNYALQVAMMITSLIAVNIIFGISPYYYYLITTIGIIFVLAPLTGRLSRLLMLYTFGGLKYNPKYKKP